MAIASLQTKGVRLVEVQVAGGFDKLFIIVEAEPEDGVTDSFAGSGLAVSLVKPVRLIGQQERDVQADKDGVNYVVEWNLPSNLTMEQYLERKTNNSVHYAEVPEVTFSRTYVCEDMSKCLCFYKAPDEAAVRRARDAVKAPIDAITALAAEAVRNDD